MPRISIISGTESGAEKLKSLLDGLPGAEIICTHSAAQFNSNGETWASDLVIINSPLADCAGDELAVHLARTGTAGILFIVKKNADPGLYDAVEGAGVVVLERPFSKELFTGLVRMCLATRRRMEGLFKRTHELEDRVEETKLVGRAKCVLIQYLNMTEPQAHRYIERQSMDMRMSRSSVARGILSAYET